MCERNVYGQVVKGYSDVDFAGEHDRRSLKGNVFSLFGNTVRWKCNLQSIVALSTTEAEYITCTEAVEEGIWVQELVSKLEIKCGVTTVYRDNQSSIYLSRNPMFHERSKHIDVRYHFIRDMICKGLVNIEMADTDEKPSEMMNKAVDSGKSKHCLKLLGVGIT